MKKEEWKTYSTSQTQEKGVSLAKKLKPGDCILLFGNLGAGKTTFVQGLAKGLGIKKRIISPTFVIIRTYQINQNAGNFYHVDLYRLQKEQDIKNAGLLEILSQNAIVAIEWPEKMGSMLPKKCWEIFFDTISEKERKITIQKKYGSEYR
jgi:tRNA threonylcarbamoyladenosine biosynthesis protein TsaE